MAATTKPKSRSIRTAVKTGKVKIASVKVGPHQTVRFLVGKGPTSLANILKAADRVYGTGGCSVTSPTKKSTAKVPAPSPKVTSKTLSISKSPKTAAAKEHALYLKNQPHRGQIQVMLPMPRIAEQRFSRNKFQFGLRP